MAKSGLPQPMKERHIVHEAKDGVHWVAKGLDAYYVMRNGISVAGSIAAFALNDVGLSLAKAYADYKADKRSKS